MEDSNKIRILFVESSPNWGGQEYQTCNEVRWLNNHGHSAWLVCDPKSEVLSYAKAYGTPVWTARLQKFSLLTTLRIWGFCVRHNIETVVVLSSKAHWFSLPVHFFGPKVVRAIYLTKPIQPGKESFLVRSACSKILTAAQQTEQHLRDVHHVSSKKISVIGSGVDLNRFAQYHTRKTARAELGLDSSRPIILTIGMLRADKGYRVLMEAARLTLRQHPNALFLLAGGEPLQSRGNLLKHLKNRIAEHSLEQNFRLLGYRTDIPCLLAACDLLVLSSLANEASPIVVREAFASGRPVVATDVGDMRTIVHDAETGFVVSPNNPEQLACAINRFLSDRDLCDACGRNALQLARARFSFDDMMSSKLAIYRKKDTTDQQKNESDDARQASHQSTVSGHLTP